MVVLLSSQISSDSGSIPDIPHTAETGTKDFSFEGYIFGGPYQSLDYRTTAVVQFDGLLEGKVVP